MQKMCGGRVGTYREAPLDSSQLMKGCFPDRRSRPESMLGVLKKKVPKRKGHLINCAHMHVSRMSPSMAAVHVSIQTPAALACLLDMAGGPHGNPRGQVPRTNGSSRAESPPLRHGENGGSSGCGASRTQTESDMDARRLLLFRLLLFRLLLLRLLLLRLLLFENQTHLAGCLVSSAIRASVGDLALLPRARGVAGPSNSRPPGAGNGKEHAANRRPRTER